MRPSGKCILEFHPTFRRLPSNDRSSFLAPATEKSKVASRTEHQAAFVKPDDIPGIRIGPYPRFGATISDNKSCQPRPRPGEQTGHLNLDWDMAFKKIKKEIALGEVVDWSLLREVNR